MELARPIPEKATPWSPAARPPMPVEAACELTWLPAVPKDWNARMKSAASLAELTALARYRLDPMRTLRLDRRAREVLADETPAARLAVLSSSTVEHLAPSLRVGFIRRDMWSQVHVGAYGAYATDLIDADSPLHAFRPDTVLFALDSHHVATGDPGEILNRLAGQWRRARDAFGAHVVQQTLLPVFPRMMGNNEHRLPEGRAALAEQLNIRLRDRADAEEVDLLALDPWLARDGFRSWFDPALWHRAKQEVHPGAAPLYGDLLGRLVAARRGRSAKCLVLDLDNTCWGGTIGDDGMDGIQLGTGGAAGEAFAEFQRYAKDLSRRGVILAVCSKNTEAIAREPFERHPDMVLRMEDIACFVANWTDKAANLRAIAARLNIGLDSLVFADDNPAERDLIRRELPEVAVPELPDDPALFAQTIAEAGYFENIALTAEDRDRAAQYRANQAREILKTSATDLDSFLRGLDMELRWSCWRHEDRRRIAQLANKTNQFNLTARRLDEAEVTAAIAGDRSLTLRLRLLDRFGDNGIVGLVAGRFGADGRDIELDLWLMSCRVLGRRVEQATLALAVAEAARLGAKRLIGIYRPTGKNGMVRDHYARLGFAPAGPDRFVMNLADYRQDSPIMRVVEG